MVVELQEGYASRLHKVGIRLLSTAQPRLVERSSFETQQWVTIV